MVCINNLDKHTLNLYTRPCIELGITIPRPMGCPSVAAEGLSEQILGWNKREEQEQ